MKFKYSILLAGLMAVLLNYSGCSTDFDLYAPPKDIFSVYCVINPHDSVHYIRVGAAYQVEGDALEYAAENDLSVKGLTVKITGPGQEFVAEEIDSFPKDVGGIFYPYMTIYRITTDADTGDSLRPGTQYTLEVRSAEDSVVITGKTLVPSGIRLKGMNYLASAGTQRRIQRADLSRDYDVVMNRGDAAAFELRATLQFEADGVPQTAVWGPTDPFDESVRCSGSSAEICYEIPEYNLIGYFENFMDDPGVVYTYDETELADVSELYLLSKALEFEMTAMDEQLYNYMLVNSPTVTDLSGSRPEYTNLKGDGDYEVLGIFGSINTDVGYVLMSKCAQYLLNLNDTPKPAGCIEPDE